MENRYYGALPEIIGEYPIEFSEICFYQYMPIKLAGTFDGMLKNIPNRLRALDTMVWHSVCDFVDLNDRWHDYYIYLTAKHVHVSPEYWGNRPGWHTDGFGTDDINYIWYDKNPTIFNYSDFYGISTDHKISQTQFASQAKDIYNETYPPFALLRLDQFVVHKVAPVTQPGFRTFVKITFSKNKYNLKGNTHNYLLDYNWEMKERSEERNHPSK